MPPKTAPPRALRDLLAGTGLEVWYDENELGGGNAWDQKIRRQIRDCDYFMPMIAAVTRGTHPAPPASPPHRAPRR